MASGSYISLALVLIFSMSKARGASSISSSQHLQAIHSMTFRRDQRGVRALRLNLYFNLAAGEGPAYEWFGESTAYPPREIPVDVLLPAESPIML
ncbi:hypothetical protein BHM03_00057151 [Ensete ventricosum]|nr:hypothetical protein BHM03_00057151 [Ensete ventricosum]